MMRISIRTIALLTVCSCAGGVVAQSIPPGVTEKTKMAIEKGLTFLVRTQGRDGAWRSQGIHGTVPCAMTSLAGLALLGTGSTPTRGIYAKPVGKAVHYLLSNAQPSGLITAVKEEGRSMYGHGFATLFLAQVHGMEDSLSQFKKIERILNRSVNLISASQSTLGGWYYYPDSSYDEGSVTVTQMQALRACRDAGIVVPKEVADKAVKYIYKSVNPDGGIRYMSHSGGPSRPPITAAAVATLYSAGKYDHPMAKKALIFARNFIKINHFSAHYYYSHFYLAQAMYQKGGEDWIEYYKSISDFLVKKQRSNGSWSDSNTGPVFCSAIALTILQLPWGKVPAYQR